MYGSDGDLLVHIHIQVRISPYNIQMASVHVYPSYHGLRGVPASLQVYALEIQPRINVRCNGASPWDMLIL